MYFLDGAHAGAAATWYYRGSTATNQTSLTLNTGSTLVLGCTATGLPNTAGLYPVFVLHKASVLTAYTIGTSTTTASPSITSLTAGTVLWDSIRGHQSGYDYFIVSSSITAAPGAAVSINLASSGFMTVYVPSLTTADSGTYYCSYISGVSASTIADAATSGSIIITMTTKSGSNAHTFKRSKALEYSMILLGASRIVL